MSRPASLESSGSFESEIIASVQRIVHRRCGPGFGVAGDNLARCPQHSVPVQFSLTGLFGMPPGRWQVYLETRHEIQLQRRKTKRFLVSLVQKIIQTSVDFNPLRQAIRKARIHQLVPMVAEYALKGLHCYWICQFTCKRPIVRLDI